MESNYVSQPDSVAKDRYRSKTSTIGYLDLYMLEVKLLHCFITDTPITHCRPTIQHRSEKVLIWFAHNPAVWKCYLQLYSIWSVHADRVRI